MTPRLSVVIPAYNSSSYLAKTVTSVKEAGEPSVEVVVVDDGSPDDCWTPVAHLNVKYIRQENQRISAARNTGLKHATGQYVSFLDGDDSWKPGVLPRLLELLDRRPEVAVAYTDAETGNPTSGYRSTQEIITKTLPAFWELPHTMDAGFRVFEPVAFRKLLMRRNLVFQGAAVMRHDLVKKTRGFSKEVFGAEDWEICMQMSAHGTFAYHPESLAIHLRHDNNVSNNKEVMVKAFCDARRVMLRDSDNLPPDLIEILKDGMKTETLFYADLAYSRGDYAEAKKRYREHTSQFGFSKSSAFGLLMSSLPTPVVNTLRRLRKA
ncbi:MAG: glycosyltransferase family 2 protein [Fimbriiglobus sp.]